MKLSKTITNLLTTSTIALTAICFSSCSDKEEKSKNVYENTDTKEASPVAELVNKNTETIEDLATKLQGITDLESAKKALPDLAKSGAKFTKLKMDTWKVGGPEKIRQFMEKNPDAQKKLDQAFQKVKTKMETLKEEHPAAEALIKDYINTLFK